jgi:hypothetical protein
MELKPEEEEKLWKSTMSSTGLRTLGKLACILQNKIKFIKIKRPSF